MSGHSVIRQSIGSSPLTPVVGERLPSRNTGSIEIKETLGVPAAQGSGRHRMVDMSALAFNSLRMTPLVVVHLGRLLYKEKAGTA